MIVTIDDDLTPSIERVVSTYLDWLSVKAPDQVEAFKQRLAAEPQAARSEAVMFNILRQNRLNPRPAEIVGQGGVDFICEPTRKQPVVVEVTTLLIENVTKASGLQHPMPHGPGSFGLITTKLLHEAINKAPQMADYPMHAFWCWQLSIVAPAC
jgi:hypothetical protein